MHSDWSKVSHQAAKFNFCTITCTDGYDQKTHNLRTYTYKNDQCLIGNLFVFMTEHNLRRIKAHKLHNHQNKLLMYNRESLDQISVTVQIKLV